eukprot:11786237-Alexandrium_andersonii.AAC.1
MSASLVGSEMCIRDSRPPPRARAFVDYYFILFIDDYCVRTPRGPGTVSYTHLTLPTICSV